VKGYLVLLRGGLAGRRGRQQYDQLGSTGPELPRHEPRSAGHRAKRRKCDAEEDGVGGEEVRSTGHLYVHHLPDLSLERATPTRPRLCDQDPGPGRTAGQISAATPICAHHRLGGHDGLTTFERACVPSTQLGQTRRPAAAPRHASSAVTLRSNLSCYVRPGRRSRASPSALG
jgi:hypothetical protein